MADDAMLAEPLSTYDTSEGPPSTSSAATAPTADGSASLNAPHVPTPVPTPILSSCTPDGSPPHRWPSTRSPHLTPVAAPPSDACTRACAAEHSTTYGSQGASGSLGASGSQGAHGSQGASGSEGMPGPPSSRTQLRVPEQLSLAQLNVPDPCSFPVAMLHVSGPIHAPAEPSERQQVWHAQWRDLEKLRQQLLGMNTPPPSPPHKSARSIRRTHGYLDDLQRQHLTASALTDDGAHGTLVELLEEGLHI